MPHWVHPVPKACPKPVHRVIRNGAAQPSSIPDILCEGMKVVKATAVRKHRRRLRAVTVPRGAEYGNKGSALGRAHKRKLSPSLTLTKPSVQMDEIPLVECALMLSGRSTPEERPACETASHSQCDRRCADRQRKPLRSLSVVHKQTLGTTYGSVAGEHSRTWGLRGAEEMRHGFSLGSVRRRSETVRGYRSRSEGANDIFLA